MSAQKETSLFESAAPRPLADKLRPVHLSEVIGQDHVLKDNGIIARMVATKHLSSIILWGPPGCGKTTIARLLAKAVGLKFEPVSAVMSGVAELRKVFELAEKNHAMGNGTLLFVDEIHRFNRAQQDAFLPYVENGTVVLVGATTENPSFELNGALLSRAQVVVLNRLDEAAQEELLQRAEKDTGKKLRLSVEARSTLIGMADGDGRYLLALAEDLLTSLPQDVLDTPNLIKRLQKRAPLYDKKQDSHYNLISALHKSLRGSDVDAALYWFFRMLEGGEDPNYIARRLTRFAVEDVGLANPAALTQAIAAWQAYERMGSPEGDLALTQLVIYLAVSPKSNATYTAMHGARAAAAQYGSLMPPKHILNAPTKMMREQGYGKGYEYDHDAPDAFSGQNYFPDAIVRQQFYQPTGRGHEKDIATRLAELDALRQQRQKKE
ncbi:MAG: replication-associated recombination protein A [Alphaproteobacteria bacterium]|nr:replication-associated recombination protein A [Alphaproteobacteria bacterium]